MAANNYKQNVSLLHFVQEFLESPSSSDEELEIIARTKNKIPKIEDYVEKVVHSYSEGQFRRHFRVRRHTAIYLIHKYEESSFFIKDDQHYGGTARISAEQCILIFRRNFHRLQHLKIRFFWISPALVVDWLKSLTFRQTCCWLLQRVSDTALKKPAACLAKRQRLQPVNNQRRRNPEESYLQCILIFLWFSANKTTLRDVSDRFGVATTTCYRIIVKVMSYLNHIAPSLIHFPTTQPESLNMARNFEEVSGFPGIIGVIDGTSINIRTPSHKIKSTYVKRHDKPAVTLQGVCNYNRQFIDIFTGIPGKIHDSRVFKLSFLSSDIPTICGQQYHLIGDNGYPLREYLLTPYKDFGNLTEPQKQYNRKLSATRVLIENYFGILKSRFRQLQLLDFHKVTKIASFIKASCVLHNLCISLNDEWEEDLEDDNSTRDYNIVAEEEVEAMLRRRGEEKRNNICTSLRE